MNKYLPVLVVLLFFGCTQQNIDPTVAVELIPEVAAYLEANPDSNIAVVYQDTSTIEANQSFIESKCTNPIRIQPYYYVQIFNAREHVYLWLSESNQVHCFAKESLISVVSEIVNPKTDLNAQDMDQSESSSTTDSNQGMDQNRNLLDENATISVNDSNTSTPIISTTDSNDSADSNISSQTDSNVQSTPTSDNNTSVIVPVSDSNSNSGNNIPVVPDANPGFSITNLQVTNIGATSATVSWITNYNTNGEVRYSGVSAEDVANATPVINLNYAASHNVILLSLNPNTAYYYKVTSTTANGAQTGSSSIGTFTTTAQSGQDSNVIIGNLSVSNITTSSATVSWTTDIASDSLVRINSSNAALKSSTDTQFYSADSVTAHNIQLTGLSSDSLYYYYVTSVSGSKTGISSSGGFYTYANTN
ncbi:MAG: fibronectin type III domain-containing protein [Candidatus Diapherotrites archaeon]|nr:fibronectin type III domain-containing protein [Candidatus Diapherotrites archaeon]